MRAMVDEEELGLDSLTLSGYAAHSRRESSVGEENGRDVNGGVNGGGWAT